MPNRNQVGILFNILGVFALRDIDLLKIESRPNPLSPFEYWFYVDFAGAPSHGLTGKSRAGDTPVDQALEQLRGMASQLKVLGSYPASTPGRPVPGRPAPRLRAQGSSAIRAPVRNRKVTGRSE